MPRHPAHAPEIDVMPGAIFSKIASRIPSLPEVFPLHVGDTWLEPCPGARMEDLSVDAHPGLHRYAPPLGLPALRAQIAEKVRARNGIPADPSWTMVTAGATGGLQAAIGSHLSAGEEVLILAPFWPLIRGITQAWRATPVEVPFYGIVDSAESAVEAIRERITPRTAAIYVSTPSNPTGLMIPAPWLQAIAELARAHDLWILADEIYEDCVFDEAVPHAAIGAFAPERTFSAFSFSKAYGMAGNRVGYLVAPPDAIQRARKIAIHTFYCAPRAGQLAALRVMRDGDAWVADARARYRAAGYACADILGLPRPQGSTFFFVDVSAKLDERGVWGFLEDCLDDGLVLAPGPSFGQGFEDHVRICFTSAPPERVEEAARRLARRLA